MVWIVEFDWDPEKNKQLKDERGISFEEIVLLIANGQIWAITDHWNPERYPNQRILLIPIEGYIYAVPFVQEEKRIFLKTAFPSRKLTKRYRQEITEAADTENEED